MPKEKTVSKDKKVTVVAELTVTWYDGKEKVREVVKSYDKAWHLAKSKPTPVNIIFNGFVRKDEE